MERSLAAAGRGRGLRGEIERERSKEDQVVGERDAGYQEKPDQTEREKPAIQNPSHGATIPNRSPLQQGYFGDRTCEASDRTTYKDSHLPAQQSLKQGFLDASRACR